EAADLPDALRELSVLPLDELRVQAVRDGRWVVRGRARGIERRSLTLRDTLVEVHGRRLEDVVAALRDELCVDRRIEHRPSELGQKLVERLAIAQREVAGRSFHVVCKRREVESRGELVVRVMMVNAVREPDALQVHDERSERVRIAIARIVLDDLLERALDG